MSGTRARGDGSKNGKEIRGPEAFVFEGLRASGKASVPGLKVGGSGKKKGGKARGSHPKRGAVGGKYNKKGKKSGR